MRETFNDYTIFNLLQIGNELSLKKNQKSNQQKTNRSLNKF